jgi:hypothetical protein
MYFFSVEDLGAWGGVQPRPREEVGGSRHPLDNVVPQGEAVQRWKGGGEGWLELV